MVAALKLISKQVKVSEKARKTNYLSVTSRRCSTHKVIEHHVGKMPLT
jgi:hypothetical protein